MRLLEAYVVKEFGFRAAVLDEACCPFARHLMVGLQDCLALLIVVQHLLLLGLLV